jgi:hypothetical protein
MDQFESAVFESVRDANLTFAGSYMQGGRETAETYWAITAKVKYCQINNSEVALKDGAIVVVWLTVPQIAKICRSFFEPITMGVFKNFLKRLLKKRWAVMTANWNKDELKPY